MWSLWGEDNATSNLLRRLILETGIPEIPKLYVEINTEDGSPFRITISYIDDTTTNGASDIDDAPRTVEIAIIPTESDDTVHTMFNRVENPLAHLTGVLASSKLVPDMVWDMIISASETKECYDPIVIRMAPEAFEKQWNGLSAYLDGNPKTLVAQCLVVEADLPDQPISGLPVPGFVTMVASTPYEHQSEISKDHGPSTSLFNFSYRPSNRQKFDYSYDKEIGIDAFHKSFGISDEDLPELTEEQKTNNPYTIRPSGDFTQDASEKAYEIVGDEYYEQERSWPDHGFLVSYANVLEDGGSSLTGTQWAPTLEQAQATAEKWYRQDLAKEAIEAQRDTSLTEPRAQRIIDTINSLRTS